VIANRGIYFISQNLRTQCTGLGQLYNCNNILFPQSIKSVFILVQCYILLSKNYVAHSVTIACVIDWIWEKKQFYLCSLALCAYEISHRTKIFPRIHIRQQSA